MKARFSRTLFITSLVAFVLSFAGMSTFAHTPLKSSQPAAGAELATPPERLELEFGGQVNLVRLSLVHEADGDVALDFKPSTERSRRFSIALPRPLTAGRYSAQWAAVGEDGHVVQGTVPFTLLAP